MNTTEALKLIGQIQTLETKLEELKAALRMAIDGGEAPKKAKGAAFLARVKVAGDPGTSLLAANAPKRGRKPQAESTELKEGTAAAKSYAVLVDDGGAMDVPLIAVRADLAISTARQAVAGLKKLGKVESAGRGQYRAVAVVVLAKHANGVAESAEAEA